MCKLSMIQEARHFIWQYKQTYIYTIRKYYNMAASRRALWATTSWHLKHDSDIFHQIKFLYFQIIHFFKSRFWFLVLCNDAHMSHRNKTFAWTDKTLCGQKFQSNHFQWTSADNSWYCKRSASRWLFLRAICISLY